MKLKVTVSTLRTLRVLEFLAIQKQVRFKDIVEALGGISHASLSRLLEDLIALGYVSKSEGLYRLHRSSALLREPSSEIPDASKLRVHEELAVLSMELKLSCGLFGTLGGQTMKILETVVAEDQPGFSAIGREMTLFPGHGFAQVFLAWAEDSRRLALFQRLEESPYQRPLVYSHWLNGLEKIRSSQRAVESEDHQPNLTRLVVPLFREKGGGPVMALGAIGRPDIVVRKETIFPALEKARDRINSILFPFPLPVRRT